MKSVMIVMYIFASDGSKSSEPIASKGQCWDPLVARSEWNGWTALHTKSIGQLLLQNTINRISHRTCSTFAVVG